MVCESTKVDNVRSPLLPVRHSTADFFVCDIFDAAPKGDMASMEHPIFSLSTKPDKRVRYYEHNGNYVEIKPGFDGLATIHDRDILIYCISQLIAALNEGREISQKVQFKAYDLLKATNRPTCGGAYQRLKAAMERLSGTRINTNIITGGKEEFKTFGLIEHAKIVRKTRKGRMQEVEVKLSDWVFGAIRNEEVLTLHRDYFRLRGSLERRVYELARKHCGRQKKWSIALSLLQKKCGSSSTLKEFKRLVIKVVQQDQMHSHIPDYSIELIENGSKDGKDQVVFYNRNSMPSITKTDDIPAFVATIQLSPDIYHDARLVAPGYDVRELEREWREWMTEPPRNPDAAFLGFCKKVYAKRGRP